MQSLSAGHHVLQATWSDSDNIHEVCQGCTISLEVEGEVVPREAPRAGKQWTMGSLLFFAQEICLFQGSYLEAKLNLVLLHLSWGRTGGPQSTLH